MKKWTTKDIPLLKGKTAIVTGTGGLGFEDALALARAGAYVIVAGRDATKGEMALRKIRDAVAGADVSFESIDLANLASVRDFARRIEARIDSLDLLINNAGVMTPPERKTTSDDFELQFGTNYLGHVALTAHLMPLLKAAKGRVVTLSSIAARSGRINFEDLQAEKEYTPLSVYAQSKVACLMFALELQARSDAGNWGVTSIAAHPGVSRTDLMTNSAGHGSVSDLARRHAWFLFQPVAQGALPTLFAATSSEAQPGGYYGPHMLHETRGYPRVARIPKQAQDSETSRKLWEVSEKLAGVTFS